MNKVSALKSKAKIAEQKGKGLMVEKKWYFHLNRCLFESFLLVLNILRISVKENIDFA